MYIGTKRESVIDNAIAKTGAGNRIATFTEVKQKKEKKVCENLKFQKQIWNGETIKRFKAKLGEANFGVKIRLGVWKEQ